MPTFLHNNVQPTVNEAEKIKSERQEINTPASSTNAIEKARGYEDPVMEAKVQQIRNKNDKYLDAVQEVTPSLPLIGSMTVAQIELRLKAFGYSKTPTDRKQSLYDKLANFM